MIVFPDYASKIAEFLLEIQAVKLNPSQPFTWASGWRSPIYCDNRLTLSYPELRRMITDALEASLLAKFKDVQAIAGVATAGIPQGVLLAERLQLPFLYVRSAPKAHGMGRQIEGRLEKGWKVGVVEDLVSTGGSSLQAIQALKSEGAEISGLISVFQYGFPQAKAGFEKEKIPFLWLSDPEYLISKAVEKEYICNADVRILQAFFADPEHWFKTNC